MDYGREPYQTPALPELISTLDTAQATFAGIGGDLALYSSLT